MLIVKGILNKEIRIADVSFDAVNCKLFVKLEDIVNGLTIKGIAVSYTVDSDDVCVEFSVCDVCALNIENDK